MSLRLIAAVASLGLAFSAAGAQDVDGFAARSFKGANGVTMLYRLFIPGAEPRKTALPLVVYLHGGGGIGDDNLKQISGGNATGTHVWTTPDAQRRHPTTCSRRNCRRANSGETRVGRAVVARRDSRAAHCRSDARVFLTPIAFTSPGSRSAAKGPGT